MGTDQSNATLTYSQEQVQQILNLAIEQQAYEGEFSHEQLVEIAEELGISQTALSHAAQSLKTQQGELVRRQSFDQYRQINLRKKAGRFAIANSSLILLNTLMGFSSPGPFISLSCGGYAWASMLGMSITRVMKPMNKLFADGNANTNSSKKLILG